MVLKQIELQNFRLHKSTSLEFSDKLNLIVGGNGQGKTSILEAIYYLSTTKNLNLAADNEAVTFGENFFDIRGNFTDLTNNKARIFFDSSKNKKAVFIDSKQIGKYSEMIGKFPIVSLIQSDHAITMGAPSERRRFIDSVISQANHTYLEILLDYNKTLRQRASLLSQIKETRNYSLTEQLDAWTDSLVTLGVEIIKHRINFIEEFKTFLNEAYNNIIGSIEEPLIVYETITRNQDNDIEENFRNEIDNVKEHELRRGTNLVGPHRDDFVFFINGMELKKYSSQGQHKTFQIALRFGQFFYMKERLGRTPVFLMDDVFGELDKYRAGKISEYLAEVGQAFITMTDLPKTESFAASEKNCLVRVENGKAAFA